MIDTQMNLFGVERLIDPDVADDATLEERFEAFHEANPQVFRLIVDKALRARRSGVRRWSMNGIFEVIRWETNVQSRGDGWKLNNSYRALYARLAMEKEPELEGFFETRIRPAAETGLEAVAS